MGQEPNDNLITYLSPPIWLSSKCWQVPRTESPRSATVVRIEPPQAFMVRLRSSSGTRPAQNMSRSAKYWVATSPIGSLERTTLAPLKWSFSSLSYKMVHSASTTFWYSCSRERRVVKHFYSSHNRQNVDYLDVLETNFGIVAFSLELQLNVEQSNFGISVLFGLHFETSVWEGFLEGNTSNKECVLIFNRNLSVLQFNLMQKGPLTSNAPPGTFLMPIMLRGSRSSSIRTASTTILEKKSFCWLISLEPIAVAAHFSSNCLSSVSSSFLGCKYKWILKQNWWECIWVCF